MDSFFIWIKKSKKHIWQLLNVVVVLLIFIAGIYFNISTENEHETERLNKIEYYFESLVELQCQVAEQQADKYLESSKRLDTLDNPIIGVNPVSGSQEESINLIDKKDLFTIYIKKENKYLMLDFYQLFTNITYINKVLDVDNYNQMFLADYRLLNREHKICYYEVCMVFEEFINQGIHMNDRNKHDKVLCDIEMIWDSFNEYKIKDKRVDINYINEKLTIKTLDYLSTINNDPIKALISVKLTKLKHSYEDLKFLRNYHKEGYKQVYNRLTRIIAETRLLIKNLSNPNQYESR